MHNRILWRTDQLEGLLAMARALENATDAFEIEPFYLLNSYDREAFQGLAEAWNAFPVHDARSQTLAMAIIDLRRESQVIASLTAKIAKFEVPRLGTIGSQWASDDQMKDLSNRLETVRAARRTIEARLTSAQAKLPSHLR